MYILEDWGVEFEVLLFNFAGSLFHFFFDFFDFSISFVDGNSFDFLREREFLDALFDFFESDAS